MTAPPDPPSGDQAAPQRIPRRPVSLLAFAEAMRTGQGAFHRRVAQLEQRQGSISEAALCVAAQANYTCWFEASFPSSLLAACRAIGTGQANALNLCQQVDPLRWRALHHRIVATQRWLGIDRPLPEPLDEAELVRLARLLGEPTPLRRALARIYLWTLVSHLRYHVSLAQLCSDDALVQGDYANYAAWYIDEHGQPYGEPADAQAFATEQRGLVRRASAGMLDQVEHLQAQLWRGRPEATRPACVQRFQRYQEIRMASIGALRWRGGLPDDPFPRQAWEALFASACDALEGWMEGQGPSDHLGRDVHESLGARTPERIDLVRTFLLQPPEEGGFFAWLSGEAIERGYLADAMLGTRDDF